MTEVEVHCQLDGGDHRVGTLYLHPRRGGQAASFEYHAAWLGNPLRFAIAPNLPLGRGVFTTTAAVYDSAPDTWGRRLMQRRERRAAEHEHRAVRTLTETDYLLGVADVSRLGALRFRRAGATEFAATTRDGVPSTVDLANLLAATHRVLRDEDDDDDLRMILAPGSSLGGARPKASVRHNDTLAIAKFPKETDEYSLERWEAITLRLAAKAGISTAEHRLLDVSGRPVMVSKRFDRDGDQRHPFVSAMTMLGLKDRQRGSYPEIAECCLRDGARPSHDVHELFRRMVFNILVSNVDDHLRNHGFLWSGRGWTLAPAYDLNPVPTDLQPRILSTDIEPGDATCSLELALSVGAYFNLKPLQAVAIAGEVATATATWRAEAKAAGAGVREIDRMASAFQHADLDAALALASRAKM